MSARHAVRGPSPRRIAGGLTLLTALSASAAGAVEITGAAFDRGGINPSRAAFAADTLRVAFETADASAGVRVTLDGNGADRTLAETTATNGTFVLAVRDTTGGPALAEGAYTVTVQLEDTAGPADTTLAFLVDTTSPAFHSLEITGPAGSFMNGDYIPLEAVMTEPIAAFTLDISVLDDAGDGDMVLVEAHDDTTYGLLYRISPANTVEDADNLPLTATATDRFGNVATSEDVLVCLSNFPPLFEAKHLVDAAGDTLPDDEAFTSGDTIRLRTVFQTRYGEELGPQFALEFTADLSEVDSEFHPFTNPAVLDTSYADSLDEGEPLAPGYVYRITALHTYTLSEENLRPEGRYDAVVTAADEGCGRTSTMPAYRIRLADLGPAPPVLDPPSSLIVTGDRITLTGTAPGAAAVRIAPAGGGPAVAEAVLDTTDGRFTAEVPLEPGRNALVAIAGDGFGHDSDPSGVIEIFRIEDATLTVAPRVRPGDPFEVALLQPAERLDLDIFNLAGDRIFHDSTTSPGAVHTFTWDGRTRRGDTAQSGPYIARVTIHATTGKRALNEAFVFTRK